MDNQAKAQEARAAYQQAEYQVIELQQGYSVITGSSDAEGIGGDDEPIEKD